MAAASICGTPWFGSGRGSSGVPTRSRRGPSAGWELLLGQLAWGFAADLSRPFLEEQAALGLDVAHQHVQHQDRAAQVDFVAQVGAPVAVVEDDRGLVRADLAGEGDDLGGGDAGFLLGPLRRGVAHELLELVEPEHPPLDEGGVVEALLEDDVDETVGERQVGRGPDHPVAAGLGGGHGDAGVDVGQLGAVGERLHQLVDLADRHGLEDVAPEEHDVPGWRCTAGPTSASVRPKRLRQAVLTDPLQSASCVRWLGEPMAFMKVLVTWVARLTRSQSATLLPPCVFRMGLSLAAT